MNRLMYFFHSHKHWLLILMHEIALNFGQLIHQQKRENKKQRINEPTPTITKEMKVLVKQRIALKDVCTVWYRGTKMSHGNYWRCSDDDKSNENHEVSILQHFCIVVKFIELQIQCATGIVCLRPNNLQFSITFHSTVLNSTPYYALFLWFGQQKFVRL